MTFGDRLRRLRKEGDMTQENVANKLNIVRSTYAYYETGKTYPDFGTVVKIATLFNVSTDYLLGVSDFAPVMRDTTKANYSVSANPYHGNDWSLKDSEQRLITAFRYLESSLQEKILAEVEQTASEIYEQRLKSSSGGIKEKKKEEGR